MNTGGPILITGATGKVGSLTARLLKSKGARVRALARNVEKAGMLAELGIETFTGDFDEPETLKPALDGATIVLVISTAAPEMADLQGSFSEIAASAGVQFIVKISGFGADAKSDINLARWHGQVEDKIIGTGVDYAFLRSAGFMQNLLGMAQLAKKGGTFKTCRTDGREALVDSRDVAEAAAAVLSGTNHSGRIYELTGPQSLTVDEVAAEISTISGNQLAPERVSEDEYRAMMLGYGMPEWMTNDMIGYGRMIQQPTGDVHVVLGRDATPLKQFVEDHAHAFRG